MTKENVLPTFHNSPWRVVYDRLSFLLIDYSAIIETCEHNKKFQNSSNALAAQNLLSWLRDYEDVDIFKQKFTDDPDEIRRMIAVANIVLQKLYQNFSLAQWNKITDDFGYKM